MSPGLTAIEIVAIGEELLSGATLDTNAARIAKELEKIGIRVVRKTTVGDEVEAITSAVDASLRRTGAVITTGGLGPTRDDTTRVAIARVFGRELQFREDLWQELERRWARRGRIPATNRSQAEVPAGATVLPNARGTAAGLALADDRRGLCIMLPGPPGEVEGMLEGEVIPYLAGHVSPGARRPFRRLLRTTGIAESAIAEKVGGLLDDLPLEVAYLPEVDGNDIRLTAWATAEADAGPVLDEGVKLLREILGTHVYGVGDVDLVEVVSGLLRQRGLRLAVAESCSGGLIAKRLTDWPGASDYFWGGLTVYSDSAKVRLLGVSEETLRRHGAVSEATALEMAERVCAVSGVACSIAVTGIAGPGGGTEEKPVGTVWLAVRVGARAAARRRHYPGPRDAVRARAVQGGLDLLRRMILQEPL
ncbi:MAG: competence/damage-inducible protein A [Gemmatimonadota bacterium]|nr:MAG: competence/damage-inducible protein A [Gemmatimonadota bacterium]